MAAYNRTAAGYPADQIRNMFFGLQAPVLLANRKISPAINLDNASTTPPLLEVVGEIEEQLQYYGSIGRGAGQKSEHTAKVYDEGREIVKDFVGAKSDRYTVFYCNSTTDGMNKLASALIKSRDDMVLSTRMEHHANDLPWRERTHVEYVEVDERGRLRLSDFARILSARRGKIRYVTVTAASNVTGYVNDVHAIARIAHRFGAKLIVDGAQIMAHRPFSMLGRTPEENVDFLVFSAHKMYAPFGGGAVVGLKSLLDAGMPMFCGGGIVAGVCDSRVRYLSSPERYEAGTPNYPGVVGMVKSMEIIKEIGFPYIMEHERRLMHRAIEGLSNIPGVVLYGDCTNIEDRVGILVFTIRGMENAAVTRALSERAGIAVRQAAFCAHPYVRRLQGIRENQKAPCRTPTGMVRVSFGMYNTLREVETLIATVRGIADKG